MRASPIFICLLNLRGEFHANSIYFLTKEQSLRQLVEFTGQDLGYDVEAWERWARDDDRLLDSEIDWLSGQQQIDQDSRV